MNNSTLEKITLARLALRFDEYLRKELNRPTLNRRTVKAAFGVDFSTEGSAEELTANQVLLYKEIQRLAELFWEQASAVHTEAA